MGVVALSPRDGTTEVLYDGDALGGPPSALRLDPNGVLHALVAYPDAWSTEEMRLLRLDGPAPTVLHHVSGFALSGLAFDDAGLIYVGNRSTDSTNGLWLVDSTGAAEGPWATGLPPLEIEIRR